MKLASVDLQALTARMALKLSKNIKLQSTLANTTA
jgi:hypothetical protein